MCADFGIVAHPVGTLQRRQRARQIALAVLHPTQTVENEGVVRHERQRLIDQLARLGQANAAIGEGIAERVVGLTVLWLQFDQPAQPALHDFELIQPFGEQRRLVEQLGVVRQIFKPCVEQVERRLRLLRLAQQCGFGDGELDRLLLRPGAGLAQQLARFVELSLSGQNLRAAHARLYHLVTAFNLGIQPQRLIELALLLGNLRQVVVGDTLVRDIERQQAIELRLGDGQVVLLQRQQRDRIDDVGIVRKTLQQLIEVLAGLVVALLADERTCQLQMHVARHRIALDKGLQIGDRLRR